jgi:hypothetical protein
MRKVGRHDAPAHNVSRRFRSLGAVSEFFRFRCNNEYFTEVISHRNAGPTRLGIDAPPMTLHCVQVVDFSSNFSIRIELR